MKHLARFIYKSRKGTKLMINTVHVGIGPLGQKVLGYAVERGCFNIVSTCAITLNVVRSILQANPGLKTMSQIPPISFFKETAVS